MFDPIIRGIDSNTPLFSGAGVFEIPLIPSQKILIWEGAAGAKNTFFRGDISILGSIFLIFDHIRLLTNRVQGPIWKVAGHWRIPGKLLDFSPMGKLSLKDLSGANINASKTLQHDIDTKIRILSDCGVFHRLST